MPRLIALLLVGAVVASGCNGDDEPEDLSAICPVVNQVPPDLDPFASLSTGSPDDVEQSLDEVRDLYRALVDDTPSGVPYPGEVLASTTIPSTSVVVPPGATTEVTEAGTAETPTPKQDLELVLDAVEEARDVLADHEFDVAAAEEDLREIPAFAEPDPLVEVRLASSRLRLLVAQVCPAAAATTTTTPSVAE